MKKRPYLTISILTIILSIIPYLIALYLTPKGYYFPGFILDSTDNMTYISKMMGAKEGWTFRNYYSPSVEDGGFIFLFYIMIGKLALLTGDHYVLWYHISRVLIIILFSRALYIFLSKFSLNERTKLIAYLLVLLGGTNEFLHGIGNLLVNGRTFRGTLDPSYVPFASALYTPHFLLVMAFQLTAWSIAKSWHDNSNRNSIFIGFLLLGIAIVHPFISVLTGVLIGGFILINSLKEKKKVYPDILKIMWFGIIPLPYLIYQLVLFNTNTMIREWNEQAVVELPSLHMIVSFLGIPFMLIIVISFTKWAWEKENFLLTYWLVGTVIASICPLIPSSTKGRLLEGMFIPIFLVIGFWIGEKWKSKKTMQIILIGLMLLNTVWLVLEPIVVDKNNQHRYITKAQMDAYKWLESNKGLVLSDFINGNYIPVYSRNKVLLGHMDESPHSMETLHAYQQWCDGKTRDIGVAEKNVKYILVDKKEGCNPLSIGNYERVFQNKQITIIKRHP